MKKIFVLLLIAPGFSAAQTKQDSLWKPIEYFIGTWTGNGEGQPGKGSYERTYQFVLNKRFVEVKNRAVYSIQEKNPKGETHEDIGYISFDKGRKRFIFRQFHIEGFVNEYTLDTLAPTKKIVFISESIENIPAGWKAKETYEIINNDEFTETFELAPPNNLFSVYTKVTFRRKK